MKYKDLIEKLSPFKDEEINITTIHDLVYYDMSDEDNETGYYIDTVNFYHDIDGNTDLICKVEQRYDSGSFENIEESIIK
jgi:hypothetical protein